MSHVEDHFTGTAGGRVYWQAWLPETDPGGVVVICHGLAEHSGRYGHVADRLTGGGYAVYAVDHRGHGRSEGPRSNLNRVAEVVADLDTLIALVAERHPELPVFLLGHSMGGMIALQYATGNPSRLTGLVLSAPLVQSSAASKLQRAAARLLSAVAPNLGVTQLDSSWVSRDPAVVKAYEEDPLNYRGKVPARTGAELLATMDGFAERIPRLRLPLLILQGTEDKLVEPAGARYVAEHAASEDLTYRTYAGLYHEVMNEPEQDAVLDDLLRWLKERT
ncbi:MAG: lysophospholipase [Micromonosporaceae bacterium]